MRIVRRRTAAGLALVAVLLLAGSASAHALPQSSDPSAGANLATAPTAVTITFGERPDPKLSTIKVLDTSGNVGQHRPHRGRRRRSAASSRSRCSPCPPACTRWPGVPCRPSTATSPRGPSPSASVSPRRPPGAGSSAGQGTTSTGTGPSAGAIVGRWLLFVGLLGLLGAATFGRHRREAIDRAVRAASAARLASGGRWYRRRDRCRGRRFGCAT